MSKSANNIAIAQSECLFQEALALYKAKQFEEAALHFVDAAKADGLAGGIAEYYAGHIYFEKLKNVVLAEKYLKLAYEKKHILPTKYIQFINHKSTKEGESLSLLQDELAKNKQMLEDVLRQTIQLESSYLCSIKNENSFTNEAMDVNVFHEAITGARAKISFLAQMTDNTFRYDLIAANFGIKFPDSFDEKLKSRVEKHVCQTVSIQEALNYLTSVNSQEYKMFEYIEKLVSINVPKKQLYHYALKVHPADLTEKLKNHLISNICIHLNEEKKSEMTEKMKPLLQEFCHHINIIFWISKLMKFRHFSTNQGAQFSKEIHESKDNISNIDDNDHEKEGSNIFASLISGFMDTENKIISKELVLTFVPPKNE